MNEHEVRAIFLLAGIDVQQLYKIANEYWGDNPPVDDPWWLVKTEHGLIKIGWRKRVMNIDWQDTGIEQEITRDDVTKSTTNVHAWTYAKAVEYLTNLEALMHTTTPKSEGT